MLSRRSSQWMWVVPLFSHRLSSEESALTFSPFFPYTMSYYLKVLRYLKLKLNFCTRWCLKFKSIFQGREVQKEKELPWELPWKKNHWKYVNNVAKSCASTARSIYFYFPFFYYSQAFIADRCERRKWVALWQRVLFLFGETKMRKRGRLKWRGETCSSKW